jgi:hypothetical protein
MLPSYGFDYLYLEIRRADLSHRQSSGRPTGMSAMAPSGPIRPAVPDFTDLGTLGFGCAQARALTRKIRRFRTTLKFYTGSARSSDRCPPDLFRLVQRSDVRAEKSQGRRAGSATTS